MVRFLNPQAAPAGVSTTSTPSRAPAKPHSGTFTKISRWELHDAPTIARPESFDEHHRLAFHHLDLSRFLFSTMLEEYPEQIPSPLKNFIEIVLETMPLDVQSIQPYMANLLRSTVLNAQKNPIEVVECVNPAGPSSQPAVAYDEISEQRIEQLHIPGSNQSSTEDPFTLKSLSGNSLVNLPFTVKFTPDSEVSSQGPIELNIGTSDTTPPAFGTGQSTTSIPPSHSRASSSTRRPMNIKPSASAPSASSSPSVDPDAPSPLLNSEASELRHIKFGLGFPDAARPPPLPKQIQEPLVAAELRGMQGNLSLPEHQKTAAPKGAEAVWPPWLQDKVETPQKSHSLKRRNAWDEYMFKANIGGSKPKDHKNKSILASQGKPHHYKTIPRNKLPPRDMSSGGGSGSGGTRLQFEDEEEAVSDPMAGKKRSREEALGDEEIDAEAEYDNGTNRGLQRPRIAESRGEETVSDMRTVTSQHTSSRNSRSVGPGASAAASSSNQSSVLETLRRSFKWPNLSLGRQSRL